MRLFNYLARTISFSFAISFYTVLIGWVVTVFGFFLSSSFIIFSYEKIYTLVAKWLPVSMSIATIFHFIQYGFLKPIGIPALISSLRKVNDAFVSDYELDRKELVDVYHRMSDLPLVTAFYSSAYTLFIGALIFLFNLYEFQVLETLSFTQFFDIIQILSLSIVIVTMFNGMVTYLATEYLTNDERANLYNRLIDIGVRQEPHSIIGIRVKFMFFIVLLVSTLLSFAALMEKARFYEEYTIEFIVVYLIASLFIASLLMQVNTNSILRIMKELRRVAGEIASGGHAGFRVLSLEKEMASIEYALMEMSWEIDGHRKNLENMVEKRTSELQRALGELRDKDNQMQKQLDMASVIQRSILPGEIRDWNELKFCVRYIAMEKIGGDFYDVFHLKDEKLGVMIADVSGHGIPAALVTTMAKISFTNAGGRFDSPRRIFQEVNQNLLDHVKTQDYMTSFMVVFDDEYNITYSNASHQKAILLRMETGQVELLDTGGLFIGAIEDANDTYTEDRTELHYGDRLILYTDGIPEALNEKRKEYSDKRLIEIVKSNKTLPLEHFANSVIEDVQNHIGNAQVEDDITLLVIELARDEAVDIIKTAKNYVRTHKYSDAIAILEHGLEKYPDNQKIVYNLAKNHFRISDYEKTIYFMEQYLENDERNKYAYYIVGAAYFQMGQPDRSVEFFERAVQLDPSFINALFALGMAYKKSEQNVAAIKTFEKVVNIDPDNKMALFELEELGTGQ